MTPRSHATPFAGSAAAIAVALSPLTALQPATPPRATAPVRVIAAVLRHAQQGDLPLFAWTLGLPQHDWLAMLADCFPAAGPFAPLPEQAYAALLRTTPPAFHRLAAYLRPSLPPQTAHPDRATRQSTWLAHAVAAAAFGHRQPWEDLGLNSVQELQTLFATHFPHADADADDSGPDLHAWPVQADQRYGRAHDPMNTNA